MSSMAGSVPLTGLPDRGSCLARAAALAALPSQSGRSLGVLWLDIDRFQAINRALGHAGGDQVIVRIAERVRSRIPQKGELYHVGADEFVLLLPDTDRAGARAVADRLQQGVSEPLELGTVLLHPSATVGIALHVPGEDAGELLARADRAKHDAKQQENKLVFSGEERVVGRHGALLERQELQVEDDLHEALDNGGLELHYQPILRRDGTLEAAEALMRCNVRGRRTPPDVLVRVAEKTGLISRLGEWSMMEAGAYCRQLCGMGLRTKIAVNISAAQLHHPEFSRSLYGVLLVNDIEPELLELELTESLVLRLSTEVNTNINECRALGNPLAIDDFGTGESCLSKLKDLPATKLKLDRAFVSVLPKDRRAFAVVRALSQLGRELGMTVVAEGVETAEQLASIWDAGVDASQGYYHAKPMPGPDLIAWMKGRNT